METRAFVEVTKVVQTCSDDLFLKASVPADCVICVSDSNPDEWPYDRGRSVIDIWGGVTMVVVETRDEIRRMLADL